MKTHIAPLPTFEQFRGILLRDFGCQIAPHIRNLVNGPKRVTLVTRRVGGSTLEWLACLNDRDRISGVAALHACRCLQIPAEQVELPD